MLKKVFNFFVYAFAIIGFSLTGMYFAVKWHLTDSRGIIDEQRSVFLENKSVLHTFSKQKLVANAVTSQHELWQDSDEWQVVKGALNRDTESVYRVAYNIDLPPRIIVLPVISEQMRYFNTDREHFKTVFAPLKILGNLTQFSWGVAGIKEETAILVEEHLKDPTSPYYLGETYEHMLDFHTDNIGEERFSRITDKDNRYYAYLYAGLYMKQLLKQWSGAGFPIDNRPDVLATLYNIGFQHSIPNSAPQTGGAGMYIGGKLWSFGSLAGSFYNSNELEKEFPRALGSNNN